MTTTVAAIDLGATSGRVIGAQIGPDRLKIAQVARFANGPVRLGDGLHWDTLALLRAAVDGLRAAARGADIASIGVDAWAVDYALLRGGRMLTEPYHYRDARGGAAVASVHARVGHAELYARNGLQFLPFNTVYQLAAEDPAILAIADRVLLIPDLIAYHLTGVAVAERTNASTTGLLNVGTRDWDHDLARVLNVPVTLLPPLVDAGTRIGPLLDHVARETGLAPGTPVVAVGSHDTASAVVATPMQETGGAYISCGTWALVGVETERPVLTAAAREANFTNEGGVDGRTRFLHNVMGLWLLNESIATWRREGATVDVHELLAAAADVGADVALFDANADAFLAPGDIPARIRRWCAEAGLRAPQSPAEVTRSIIESLAQAFADAVAAAAELSGQAVNRIHIVGGGALNALLCQRTADRSGIVVEAGPVEATAIGNVLVQARTVGAVTGTLESLRRLVGRAFTPTVYTPTRS